MCPVAWNAARLLCCAVGSAWFLSDGRAYCVCMCVCQSLNGPRRKQGRTEKEDPIIGGLMLVEGRKPWTFNAELWTSLPRLNHGSGVWTCRRNLVFFSCGWQFSFRRNGGVDNFVAYPPCHPPPTSPRALPLCQWGQEVGGRDGLMLRKLKGVIGKLADAPTHTHTIGCSTVDNLGTIFHFPCANFLPCFLEGVIDICTCFHCDQ